MQVESAPLKYTKRAYLHRLRSMQQIARRRRHMRERRRTDRAGGEQSRAHPCSSPLSQKKSSDKTKKNMLTSALASDVPASAEAPGTRFGRSATSLLSLALSLNLLLAIALFDAKAPPVLLRDDIRCPIRAPSVEETFEKSPERPRTAFAFFFSMMREGSHASTLAELRRGPGALPLPRPLPSPLMLRLSLSLAPLLSFPSLFLFAAPTPPRAPGASAAAPPRQTL